MAGTLQNVSPLHQIDIIFTYYSLMDSHFVILRMQTKFHLFSRVGLNDGPSHQTIEGRGRKAKESQINSVTRYILGFLSLFGQPYLAT